MTATSTQSAPDDGAVVYLNGAFVPPAEATVSVFDHGFLYGDGIFESLVSVNGRIFRLDDHLARLYASATALKLRVPLGREELAEAVKETLRRNDLRDAYVRIMVSRGPGFPVLDPRASTAPTLVIRAHARSDAGAVGTTYRDDGLRLKIVSVRKTPPVSIPSQAKTLNYINNILARMEAVDAGADEALMLDIHGFVAEAPGMNVFAVSDGRLRTPPTLNVLPGITRRSVIDLARADGYDVSEQAMTSYDLYTADEAFVCSTYGGIQAVAEVDGRKLAAGVPGPVTTAMRTAYRGAQAELGVPV